jgi:hypothetical protein
MLAHERPNEGAWGNLRQNKDYLKIQQYSNNLLDLGTMNHEQYAKALEEVYSGILPLMRPKAHCIINVNDVWEKQQTNSNSRVRHGSSDQSRI